MNRLFPTLGPIVSSAPAVILSLPRRVRLTVIFTATTILVGLNLLDSAQFLITQPKYSDYFLYYLAAHLGLTKGWGAMYDPRIYLPALWHATGRVPMPYLNPPPLAWLAVPLTLMPYLIGLAIWSAAIFGTFLLAWWLLAPGTALDRFAHLLAVLGLSLVVIMLHLGQVVSLVMAAVALCWWLIRKERPLMAGMVLAVMLLKPQTALLVPLTLLIAGYRRVFIGWALVAIPLTAGSLFAMGPEGIRNFQSGSAVVYDGWAPVVSSINGLVPDPLAMALQVAALGLTLATAWRARQRGPELPIAAGVVGSTLVVPYLHVYDLATLALCAWLALRVGLSGWQQLLLLASYVLLAFASEGNWSFSLLIVRFAWLVGLFMLSSGSGVRERQLLPAPAIRPQRAAA